MPEKEFDKVMDVAKRRGFIWGPSPNIYHGGVSGFYDWGPLGKLLKNKVEDIIRKNFMLHGFWEVECPAIMPKIVWEASGHYEGFVDPIVQCTKCKAVFRADNLIKEHTNEKFTAGDFEKIESIIEKKKIKCSRCSGSFGAVGAYNLMMKTTIGLDQEAYLRPETATTTYLLFPEYYRFFRTKLPFGVFQIGKAYRNEISPRQGVFRTREFTQAEAQLFVLKEQKNVFDKYDEIKNEKLPLVSWQEQKKSSAVKELTLSDAIKKGFIKNKAYAWCLYVAYKTIKEVGFADCVRVRQHFPEERAHYAEDAWDIEIKTERFGWFEICGVHDRSDYDLRRHASFSGAEMQVGKEQVHILEIAFGLERPTYCLLERAFREDKVRSWLHFPMGMAPVDIAVFPLVKKDGLSKKAKEVFALLEKDFVAIYDETGSIGRMYRRMDEIGTSLCVTVDHQTLKDDTITIREISTMEQIRVKVNDLKNVARKLIEMEIEFKKVKGN